MNTFDRALSLILRLEGGYVNDPDDRGGATNQGITQETYDRWREGQGQVQRPVLEIARAEVAAIYHAWYWDAGKCDQLPPDLGIFHFDGRVQHRPRVANKILQRALGVVPDGIIGPKTLCAARQVPHIPDIINQLFVERLRFYRAICQRDPSQLKFLSGWIWRLIEVRKQTI